MFAVFGRVRAEEFPDDLAVTRDLEEPAGVPLGDEPGAVGKRRGAFVTPAATRRKPALGLTL